MYHQASSTGNLANVSKFGKVQEQMEFIKKWGMKDKCFWMVTNYQLSPKSLEWNIENWTRNKAKQEYEDNLHHEVFCTEQCNQEVKILSSQYLIFGSSNKSAICWWSMIGGHQSMSMICLVS